MAAVVAVRPCCTPLALTTALGVRSSSSVHPVLRIGTSVGEYEASHPNMPTSTPVDVGVASPDASTGGGLVNNYPLQPGTLLGGAQLFGWLSRTFESCSVTVPLNLKIPPPSLKAVLRSTVE